MTSWSLLVTRQHHGHCEKRQSLPLWPFPQVSSKPQDPLLFSSSRYVETFLCDLPWKWIISQLDVKRKLILVVFHHWVRSCVLLWPSQTAEELPGPGAHWGAPDTNSALLPPTTRCGQKHCLVVTDTITLDESLGVYFIRHHCYQCRRPRGN